MGEQPTTATDMTLNLADSEADLAEAAFAGVPPDSVVEHDDPRVARTRQAVHEAGRDLLIASGPAAVTHAAVASAARISRTTLYKYWPTRFDLLADICRAAKPESRIESSGNTRADLIRMTSGVAENLSDREARKMFASMVAQSQWDDEAKEAQAAMIGVGMADLSRVLEAGTASGDLPVGIDPERAATRLLGPIFFAAIVIDVELGHADVESIVDDWLASICG